MCGKKMKVIVLGATGTTGQLVIDEALASGHEVIAFVRNPNVLKKQKGLSIVKGSVESQGDLQNCFAGADAVVSCLGARPSLRVLRKGSDLQQRTLPKIIAAINAAKVKRFILMSSFGSGETRDKAAFFIKIFLYSFVAKKLFDDKVLAELSLSTCQANWTAVYPVTLHQGPAESSWDLVPLDVVRKVPGIPRLAFATVATVLVRLIADENRAGQKLLLTTRRGWR